MPLRPFLIKSTYLLFIILCFTLHTFSQSTKKGEKKVTSGNPIFPGWYADPEVRIFDHQYWIYPTYSAPYEKQVFMDAFSSPDLIHWTKHSHVMDTANFHWAKKAVWAPSIVEKNGKYYFQNLCKTREDFFAFITIKLYCYNQNRYFQSVPYCING